MSGGDDERATRLAWIENALTRIPATDHGGFAGWLRGLAAEIVEELHKPDPAVPASLDSLLDALATERAERFLFAAEAGSPTLVATQASDGTWSGQMHVDGDVIRLTEAEVILLVPLAEESPRLLKLPELVARVHSSFGQIVSEEAAGKALQRLRASSGRSGNVSRLLVSRGSTSGGRGFSVRVECVRRHWPGCAPSAR